MFKIYFTKEKRYSNRFKSVFDALELARLKGLECCIEELGDCTTSTIAFWSPTEGITWHIGNQLTAKEAAFLLGLSAIRVIQFCQQERLGKKFGKSWMIEIDELGKFAQSDRPTGIAWRPKYKCYCIACEWKGQRTVSGIQTIPCPKCWPHLKGLTNTKKVQHINALGKSWQTIKRSE